MVHALTTYDNTAANLANPNDPPRAMSWGKRMYAEMLLVYFSYQPLQRPSRLKPGPVNISTPRGEVELNTTTNGAFSLEVADFTENYRRVVVTQKPYSRGTHRLAYDLTGLPFGNYVFRLKGADGEVIEERIFLYLASDLFD